MPGARWFPGATLNYAEHALRTGPGKGDNDLAVVFRREDGLTDRLTFGRLRHDVAAVRAGSGGVRSQSRRPGRRLGSQFSTRLDRVPRDGQPRSDLVVLLAGLRGARGHRPVRPNRSGRAGCCRRLPLQRPALRRPAGRGRAARGHAEPARDRRHPIPSPANDAATDPDNSVLTWDDLLEQHAGAELRVRSRAVRPSALGALLVRDNRAAQRHRPRPRRDRPRAPQGAGVALRSRPG